MTPLPSSPKLSPGVSLSVTSSPGLSGLVTPLPSSPKLSPGVSLSVTLSPGFSELVTPLSPSPKLSPRTSSSVSPGLLIPLSSSLEVSEIPLGRSIISAFGSSGMIS